MTFDAKLPTRSGEEPFKSALLVILPASPAGLRAMMPYWRLSSFYFFYFASLGTLVPYWGLYLKSLGFDAVAIGSLMAILMATKIVAPNLWGWLADHLGHRMRIVQLASLLALLSFLGMFAVSGFWGVALVMVFYSFFWNASLPQFEAVTFNYLGDRAERLCAYPGLGLHRLHPHRGGCGPGGGSHGAKRRGVGGAGQLRWCAAGQPAGPGPPGKHPPRGAASLLAVLRRPEVLAFFAAVFLMQMSHGP